MKSIALFVLLLLNVKTFSQAGPGPRHLEEIAFDTDRNTLILSGGGETVLGKGTLFPDPVSEWDGKIWKHFDRPGPKNRYGHALVYDPTEKATYLIGGVNEAARSISLDVWKWKDHRWSLLSSDCPAKTVEAAYDPVVKRVLVYGDVYNKTALTQRGDPVAFELWEFKLNAWKKLSTEGPQIHSQFEIAFDAKRNALVIPVWENGKSMVWEWKDEKWSKTVVPGKNPDERNRFALAYHAKEKATFLFGGRNNTNPFLQDFWKWDGVKWTEISALEKPPARAAATMESGNDGLYLYGGVAPWGLSNEIWKWQNSKWQLLNADSAMTEARTTHVLKDWLSEHPEDVDVLTRYGTLLGKQNKYDEAIEYLKRAHGLNPIDHNILMNLCDVLFAQGKNSEAENLIMEVVKAGKMQRNSYVRLANYYLEARKFIPSIACFEKALEMERQAGDYYNLACAYALMNNKDKAFEALNQSVDFGFSSKEQCENDSDLEALRSDSRWGKLIDKIMSMFPPDDKGKPDKRAHHEMVYNETEKVVLLISGSTPLNGGQSFRFFNDIWKYDATRWAKVGHAGDERSGIRLAYDTKQNKLYSFGGFTKDNQSSGELRVLENGDWKTVTNVPEMKAAEPGFVYDAIRDKLITFGGSAGRGVVNGITWEWDGKAWTRFEGLSPEGRQGFVMAYDTRKNKTILWGGMNVAGQILEDGVWEFDGKEWKNISTQPAPEVRMLPGYAYDSKRGMLIIFGGAGKSGVLGDTWGWNGSKWKKLADSGPPARMMGYMAYDKARDKIILFGGRVGWPNDLADTWEWDGEKWMAMK